MGKMGLYLKSTAGLLLLFQAFHLASLQHSTDSPGRTIDGGWLRDLAKGKTGSQNAAVTGEEPENYQKADATTVESNSDYSGIASGSMVAYNEEEESVTGRDDDAREESDDRNVTTTNTTPSTVPNVTTEQLPDIKVSPTTATTDSTNSSEANMTNAEDAFNNSTATPQNSTTELSIQNSTSLLDYSNHTDSQTTLAPEGNATQESTTKPAEDTRLTTTESTNTTTLAPEIAETSATSSSTTFFPSTSTEIGPDATTTATQNTPEANRTGKGSATGNSSERGLESDSHKSKRNGAWGAILGTAAAAGFVGLVAYFILKKKYQRGFSHRKLVEEYPSDPVLRLDNSEPLDLNIGRSAYYNPALQGDNIQMDNIPGRH